MIVGYPPAYPDELHYSVNARFNADWGYTDSALSVHLYGGMTSATVDVPCRLDALAARLPAEHGYTADTFIHERTLYPLYAAFLTPERGAAIEETMRGAEGVSAFALGYTANKITPPSHLRYCPDCVVEERATLGECYWHRAHQAPGVLVCPAHGTALRDSIGCGRDALMHYTYVTAQDAIGGVVAPSGGSAGPDPDPDPDADILGAIAGDVRWLLGQRGLSLDREAFRERYLAALRDRGLASLSGSVHQGKLVRAFEEFYPRALLDRLQCADYVGDKPHSGWLVRIVRVNNWMLFHPLRHLLVMRFLGYTAETFFGPPPAYAPFGEGPYPCLNPASDHYRHLTIDTCALKYHNGLKALIGAFACDCGFAYRRRRLEGAPEDRFTYSSIATFGPVWEAHLGALWQDETLTVEGVGKKLGVSSHTAYGQAMRLGLPRLRPGAARPLSRASGELEPIDAAQRHARAREERKAEWVRERDAHPGITGEQLRETVVNTYKWLQRHEPDWLEAETPPTPPRAYVPPSPTAKDWSGTDRALADAVREAARRLLAAPDRPRQVVRKRIAIEAGCFKVVAAQLGNLPLTKAALDEVAETREGYVGRKIAWASTYYREQGIVPRILVFRQRIGMLDIDDNEQFREAIEAAVRSLAAGIRAIEPSPPPLPLPDDPARS